MGIPDIAVQAKARTLIGFSLKTADKSLTNLRHAAVAARVEALFKAERAGPVDLSFKQTQALAGLAYRQLVASNEDEPGRPRDWERFRVLLGDAADYLDPDGDGKTSPRFGPKAAERALKSLFDADAFLASEGVSLSPTSRATFVQAVVAALFKAADLLSIRATGDYRPDPYIARYPEWQAPTPHPDARPSLVVQRPPSGAGRVTLTGLVEGWWTRRRRLDASPAPMRATATRWHASSSFSVTTTR